MVPIEDILENKGSLNIAQYVSNVDSSTEQISLNQAMEDWENQSETLKKSMNELFQILN